MGPGSVFSKTPVFLDRTGIFQAVGCSNKVPVRTWMQDPARPVTSGLQSTHGQLATCTTAAWEDGPLLSIAQTRTGPKAFWCADTPTPTTANYIARHTKTASTTYLQYTMYGSSVFTVNQKKQQMATGSAGTSNMLMVEKDLSFPSRLVTPMAHSGAVKSECYFNDQGL